MPVNLRMKCLAFDLLASSFHDETLNVHSYVSSHTASRIKVSTERHFRTHRVYRFLAIFMNALYAAGLVIVLRYLNKAKALG